MKHVHRYYCDDVPGVSNCKCGAYRVWNRETRSYTEYESEGEL